MNLQNEDLDLHLTTWITNTKNHGMTKHSIVEAVSTALICAVFICSAVAIVENQGLDGIELDWEYQVNEAWAWVVSKPEDRNNLTGLLEERYIARRIGVAYKTKRPVNGVTGRFQNGELLDR